MKYFSFFFIILNQLKTKATLSKRYKIKPVDVMLQLKINLVLKYITFSIQKIKEKYFDI